jgi:hypothetical protein
MATRSRCAAGSRCTSRAVICNWWSKACRARGRARCSNSSCSARRARSRRAVRPGAQAGAADHAARGRRRHVAGRGGAARRGDGPAAARAAHPRRAGAGRRAGCQCARPNWCARCSRSMTLEQPGRCDPAGARRRLDRRPVGLQRRNPGAHHRAEPCARDVRRRPRDRLHHCRFLRRPACADTRPRRRSWSARRATCGSARSTCSKSGLAMRSVRGSTRWGSGSTRRRPARSPSSNLVLRQQLRLAHDAQRLQYAVLSQHQRLAQRAPRSHQGRFRPVARRLRSGANVWSGGACACGCWIRRWCCSAATRGWSTARTRHRQRTNGCGRCTRPRDWPMARST